MEAPLSFERVSTECLQNSSCYFLGDKENDSLQRLYGVAFPDKKLLENHLRMLEEAAKRDHRRIGQDQKLFAFKTIAPGCPFLLPHGTRIFNALQSLLRSEYRKRHYDEVQSPSMYDVELWKTSGHWDHYQDDIFRLKVEEREWALKPMNCPGHCHIFANEERSWKELPIRMADFSVLHRNEASGALAGLTRVRRFQQDDAHLFCRPDQIKEEIQGLFDFLKVIYGLFGFTFKLKLSTRPDKYLGDIATWDHAETELKDALDEFSAAGGGQWELNEGDGAFYGPKIDAEISDALGRSHQCATIQLDFNLPRRFSLEYVTGDAPHVVERTNERTAIKSNSQANSTEAQAQESATKSPPSDATASDHALGKPKELGIGRARPVMLHRAILGSFERFLAIITEHFAGRWPFWLSPRQVLIIPVMPAANDYVLEVQKLLEAAEIYADADISGNTMQKKILRGQQALYNFIFGKVLCANKGFCANAKSVVGAQERTSRTVNIRNRDDPKTQSKGALVPLDRAIQALAGLKLERRLENTLALSKVDEEKLPKTELEVQQAEEIKQLKGEIERLKPQGTS